MTSVQLDIDQIELKARVVTSTELPQRGARVLFLDSGTTHNYASHESGRMGYFQHANGGNGLYTCEANGHYDTHRRLVVINPTVQIGDEVIVLRADGHNLLGGGIRVRITSVSDSVTRLTGQAVETTQRYSRDSNIWGISHWALPALASPVTPNGGAAAVATTEIPEIPEYWENRVRTIAREYSRRYGMCSRVDQALAEIFSVNQRYRVGNQNGTIIVRDPQGNEVAVFSGPSAQQDAQDFVNLKNANNRFPLAA